MTELQKRLFDLRDAQYAAFQSKLTPSVAPELFIGVRVPVLRQFAKGFLKSPAAPNFSTPSPTNTTMKICSTLCSFRK